MINFKWEIGRGYVDRPKLGSLFSIIEQKRSTYPQLPSSWEQMQNDELQRILAFSCFQQLQSRSFLMENFDRLITVNETELSEENFIEKVETAWYDQELQKLQAYVQNKNVAHGSCFENIIEHYEDYIFKTYFPDIKNKNEINEYMDKNSILLLEKRFLEEKHTIKKYIHDEYLSSDYCKFVSSQPLLKIKSKNDDVIRRQLIETVLSDYLTKINTDYIYVWRDSDRKSLLITILQ